MKEIQSVCNLCEWQISEDQEELRHFQPLSQDAAGLEYFRATEAEERGDRRGQSRDIYLGHNSVDHCSIPDHEIKNKSSENLSINETRSGN